MFMNDRSLKGEKSRCWTAKKTHSTNNFVGGVGFFTCSATTFFTPQWTVVHERVYWSLHERNCLPRASFYSFMNSCMALFYNMRSFPVDEHPLFRWRTISLICALLSPEACECPLPRLPPQNEGLSCCLVTAVVSSTLMALIAYPSFFFFKVEGPEIEFKSLLILFCSYTGCFMPN